MGIAGDIALILVVCVLCGLVVQRLGFPLILGYIIGGVLLSPDTIGPRIQGLHEIELLADIGVALLLFTVGLEFPAERLKPVWKVALIGAPLQMIAVGAYGYGLGQFMGWDWQQSIWFGSLITVSSTMVVVKVLMNRGLMETLSSKVMLGILVVQDVAVIPMMILLPALSNLEQGLAAIGVALVRAAVFVTIMFLVGGKVLPWLLKRVVGSESHELFIIVVLGIGLGVGYATYLVGLSFAFGAFLAGIVLNRSEYSHDALQDMIPLREVFALLFFASVGLILKPGFLWTHIWEVLGLSLAILVGKGILMALITRAFGFKRIIPLALGLSMNQIGEFAFVLARVGRETKGLSEDVYYLIICLAVITMALTPFSSSPTLALYDWWIGKSEPAPIEEEACPKAKGRPVLIGFGSQGRFIGGLLQQVGFSPLVVDADLDRVAVARDRGFEAACAEATSGDLLEQIEVSSAPVVIVSIDDRFVSRALLDQLRAADSPPLVVLASSLEHLKELHEQGIHEAVLPELETGLEIVHQALRYLDYDEVDAFTFINGVRRNHYRFLPLPEMEMSTLLSELRMEWVELVADRHGRLDELGVRRETGALVVGVVRDGKLRLEVGPSLMLRQGDRVGIVGNRSQRSAFKAWASSSPPVGPPVEERDPTGV